MTGMGSTARNLDGALKIGARLDDFSILAFIPHATREHVSVLVGQADDGYYTTWLALGRTALSESRVHAASRCTCRHAPPGSVVTTRLLSGTG